MKIRLTIGQTEMTVNCYLGSPDLILDCNRVAGSAIGGIAETYNYLTFVVIRYNIRDRSTETVYNSLIFIDFSILQDRPGSLLSLMPPRWSVGSVSDQHLRPFCSRGIIGQFTNYWLKKIEMKRALKDSFIL